MRPCHKATRAAAMAERSNASLWGMRALYPVLALVLLFIALLPVNLAPERFAGPDLLTALTLAWGSRRPDHLPAVSIAGVMLLADFLLQRPPGLWALLVLIGAEWMKSQDRRLRDSTFVDEIVTLAIVLFTITLANRAVLIVLLIPPGALSLVAMQYVLTLLAYPILAGFLYIVLRVRRGAPADYDPVGRRI